MRKPRGVSCLEDTALAPKARGLLTVAVLLAVGTAAFCMDLGQEVRLDGREVIHAEIAREMVETGDYAVPMRLGKPYIDKPPLYNWIVAALFTAAGRSSLALARLPVALSALAAMVGIYILGRRWFTPRVALWAALMWPTFWLVNKWAGMSRGDMLLASLIFWAVIVADFSAAAKGRTAAAVLWCAASVLVCGAVMSKGLQAVLFFAIPVAGIWRARRGRWVPPVAFMLVTVLMVGAAVAGWSWAADARHPGHMKELSGYEFGTGLKEHPKRLYLYLDQLAMATAPWSIFALGAAIYTVQRFRRSGYGLWAVPALTLAVSIVILTLTPNKRAHYALPIVPLWAMFLAAFMEAGVSRTGPAEGEETEEELWGSGLFRWAFTWPLRVALVCAVAMTAAAPIFWAFHVRQGKTLGAVLLGSAVVPALYGLVASFRRRPAQAAGALLAASLLVAIVARPLALRYYFEPPDMAGVGGIERAIPEGTPVAEFRVDYEFLYLKMDRPVSFLHTRADVRAFLAGPGERYLIARAADAPALSRATDRPARDLGTWRVGERSEMTVTVLAIGR